MFQNSARAWRRALVGGAVAAVAVMLLPASGQAVETAGPSPTINLGSTSYSGQARPFRVRIVNRVAGARVDARITNSPRYGDSPMSCSGSTGAGSTWTCTARSGPLNIGSVVVRAVSVHPDPSKTSGVATRSGSITSSFSASAPGSVDAGDSYTVSGRYDHLSGVNDNRVSARVTSGGGTVGGCTTSGTSYRCTVRTNATASGRLSVQVNQNGSATRSRTVTTSVAGTAAPVAPAFDVPSTLTPDAGPLTISGTAGRANLRIEIAVDDPGFGTIATTCTSSGSSGTFSCTLPSSLGSGTHTIYARSRDTATNQVSVFSSRIVVVSATTPTAIPSPTKAPTTVPPVPTITPTPTTSPTPTEEPEPQTEDENEALAVSGDLGASQDALVLLLVLGLAVVTLARPGPLALARRGTSVSFNDTEAAELGAAQTQEVGFGDHSGTWAFAGHDLTDEFSRKAPENVAPWSPFLGRVLADGVELRAMLGTLWWLSPIVGAVLGGVAAQQAGWQATVPPTSLVLLILVLAAFDAFAGLAAGLVFGLLTLGDLGPDSGHGLLVILSLALLWSTLPLVAGLLRPLRRHGSFSWEYLWDRLGDAVIPALVTGWLAWALAASFDLITGAPSSLTDNAATVGFVAAGATAARVLIDQLAAFLFPERLRVVGAHEDLPSPRGSAILGGVVLRVALFAFAGHVIIGDCWQLWVGIVLFALPDVLALIDNRLGWSFSHKFLLPVGITAVVSLVVVGSVLVTIAVADAPTVLTALRSAFLAASLAPALLGVAQTFDGSSRRPGSTWTWQLAGLAVVAVGTAIALQGWNF